MQTAQPVDEKKQVSVIIHGHFYQPPRENPWTQTIPSQDSAKPYHDWNERITSECYQANTRARVLDDAGNILSFTNNFVHLSFNIGPTLLAWLYATHPDVCQKVLDADRASCEKQHGHGNAIAQVYNHVIMPLANERDQITQILWGLREFRQRFGRDAESIWLAETAINQTTLRGLIDQGIKYVILSPTQAGMVRKIGDRTWTDVSDNTIDPTQPYRLFLSEMSDVDEVNAMDAVEDDDQPMEIPLTGRIPQTQATPLDEGTEKFIDVFFYDAALANDISFNHLLRDGNALARRIQDAAGRIARPRVLIHVATDGEIYGHHEAGGERTLALLLHAKLPDMRIEVTNYGRYLELNPPTMEVELKAGPHGEGTAWSCAHGVGRWYRDCGCCISNPPGWTQQWRTPLRKAFDVVRDALAEVFEQVGAPLLNDVWAARDDYIEYLLDPSEHTLEAFLNRHASHALSDEEISTVLRLLEAQRYVLFSYTSCAWFFNDLSGLEPIQNLRYAARAIQLMDGIAPQNLEGLLLETLREARSNLPEFGSGKDIYLKYVKPDVYTPERAANQALLAQLIRKNSPLTGKPAGKRKTQSGVNQEEHRLHIYLLRYVQMLAWSELFDAQADKAETDGLLPEPAASQPSTTLTKDLYDLNVYSGVLQLIDTTTRQTWKLLCMAFIDHNRHPVSYLKRIEQDDEFAAFRASLTESLAPQMDIAGRSKLALFLERSGFQCYTLADLYAEDRERLFAHLLNEYGKRVEDPLETAYKDSLDMIDYLSVINLPIPPQFQASMEFSLEYHLLTELEKLYTREVGGYSPALVQAALDKTLQVSQAHRLTLNTGLLKQRVTTALTHYIAKLSARFLAVKLNESTPSRSKILEEFLRLLRETLNLVERAETIGVNISKTALQDMAYDILEDTVPRYLSMLGSALKNAGHTENEQAHNELHRFFQEYKFMQECLKLAKRLQFNIDRYREYLISAELTMQV